MLCEIFSAKLLAESLKRLFPGRKFTFVTGVMADKDVESILGLLLPIAVVTRHKKLCNLLLLWSLGAFVALIANGTMAAAKEKGVELILIKAPTNNWKYYWYNEWEAQIDSYAKEKGLEPFAVHLLKQEKNSML